MTLAQVRFTKLERTQNIVFKMINSPGGDCKDDINMPEVLMKEKYLKHNLSKHCPN